MDGGFQGNIYPINPKYEQIGETPCYASIQAVQDQVDMAVITTPRKTVPGIVRECGEHGVRAVIVISAGFSEHGGEGADLEQELLDISRHYGIRVLGPNCLGLIHPSLKMNATFSKNGARTGHLALVSQSGALCTAMLDWAEARDIGFSSIVSLGDAADVDFGDILDYLAQDPETRSILLYVEGIRDARSFMSGLRVASRLKPVIVIKAGRHQESIQAAMTHTGAMVGGDDVFDAALRRAGAIRAMTIDQLFSAAQLLSSRYRIRGNRLAIISNGGGLGVMATDRAIDQGIKLAGLSGQTISEMDTALPSYWSRTNPVDLLGDASPDRYRAALSACIKDPGVDGVLVMLAPQAMTDGMACADAVIEIAAESSKPVMACWMGDKQLAPAKAKFALHHIPSFDNPESSIEAFAFLADHYRSQQLLMQLPAPRAESSEPDIDGSRLIIESAFAERRSMLNSMESRAILHAFSVPFTQATECSTANEALVAAETLGYPIAMKINSPDISHKTDAGGVRLNIVNAQAVRKTYLEMMDEAAAKLPDSLIKGVTVEPMYHSHNGRELLIGVVRDPVFGPVISFGSGGINVEAIRDNAIALPPLNTFLTLDMISRTRISRLLGQYRHMPAIDMDKLVQVLRRVSEMVCELPEIRSLDINPAIADENGVMVVDARIEIERVLPSADHYAHMAIHPYPANLAHRHQLADGTNILIRPIRPEDASIEKSFVNHLSSRSKYFRFMQEMKELTQDMLVRFTQLDYHRELALIAVLEQHNSHPETELAVARYSMNADGQSCEFALVVADEWQGKGLGTQLMQELMEAARQRGFHEMNGEVIAENVNMLQLVRELGFRISTDRADTTIRHVRKKL